MNFKKSATISELNSDLYFDHTLQSTRTLSLYLILKAVLIYADVFLRKIYYNYIYIKVLTREDKCYSFVITLGLWR